MVYVLFGQEDFLVRQELERIKAGLGPQDMVSLNTTRFAGDGLAFPELQGVCDAVPFLAPARVVVVEGLLARFNEVRGRRRSSRATRAPGAANGSSVGGGEEQPQAGNGRAQGRTGVAELEGGWDQLADYIRQMPETTHLVLLEGPLNRNNPLLALLTPVAEVREQRKLRGTALEQWVRQRAAALQCQISPPALRLLIEMVGDNLWVLSSELEKLSLYAEGRPVQPQDVHQLVASARESTIFSLIDAVAERRLSGAQQALHHLLQGGWAPSYILFMLARQVRLLLLAKVLMGQGLSGLSLMGRLGITAEYPFRKTVEQSRGYTIPALEATLERLLDTDVALKTGKLEPEMALELLVTDLCRSGS